MDSDSDSDSIQQSAFKVPIKLVVPVRKPLEIKRHHKRDKGHKSYQRFYKNRMARMSSIRARRIPDPEELGMLPYDISDFLQKAQCSYPNYASTKFCKNMYTGCTNPYCTYAHSNAVARWTPKYAAEDIHFSRLDSKNSIPKLIVNLRDEDDSDSEKKSITLSKHHKRKHTLAHDKWFIRQVGEYDKIKRELGL